MSFRGKCVLRKYTDEAFTSSVFFNWKKGLVMKCERQQASSCHGKVGNVIQITAKTTYTKYTMVLEGHQTTNTHMKMLFGVRCINEEGCFYKVILLVIISAYLFFSWIAKHNVILRFLTLLALSTRRLPPSPSPKNGKKTKQNKPKNQNQTSKLS